MYYNSTLILTWNNIVNFIRAKESFPNFGINVKKLPTLDSMSIDSF